MLFFAAAILDVVFLYDSKLVITICTFVGVASQTKHNKSPLLSTLQKRRFRLSLLSQDHAVSTMFVKNSIRNSRGGRLGGVLERRGGIVRRGVLVPSIRKHKYIKLRQSIDQV